MADHGVFVSQQATSVSTPVLADSGIPFAIGTAPVQSAAAPGKTGIPVLCTSWDEAVEQLGYSDDWKTYSLCEVMYSHFKLYASQPLILYNLLDPAEMDAEVAAQDYPVDDHQVALPLEAIASSIVVQVPGEEPESPTTLVEGTDYAVRYNSDDNACIVELLGDSASYEAETLNIAYSKVDGSGIEAADVAMAVDAVDLCMTELGVIPDLLIAPGWSGDTEVAAVMAAKLPTDGFTDTATVSACGYDPYLMEEGCFIGAVYSVLLICGTPGELWLAFIWALPATGVVCIVFSCVWGNRYHRAVSVSALIWMLALALFLTIPVRNMWLVFVVSVPVQALAVFWFILRKSQNNVC